MKHLNIFIGIFLVLSASRFIPHPPNFTSLLALSFYIPAIFGRKFIPSIMLSFLLTDLIIGFHNTTFFTWGSVLVIGLISKFFSSKIFLRLLGAIFGAVIFFIITNFGVWLNGSYGYNLSGFVNCYILAIPFFAYSLISTLIFSSIIESIILFFNLKLNIKLKK
jgi:hypothetical protein